jgi:uncharacterized protein (DUF58 family)
MAGGQPTFPLVPRRRLIGMTFGTMRSVRRGRGSEIAGSRPYRRGDEIRSIDWAASARISSARGQDEFIVRERYADEGPRVVVVCDRSPGFAFFPPELPWLDKAAAMRCAVQLVNASSAEAGGFVGYADFADGEPRWLPPRGERRLAEVREERIASTDFTAPADGVERCLEHLFQHSRIVTAGSFVFVCSDFLSPPTSLTWLTAVEHLWDVIPIVIQDPVWEQSFPAVGGIAIPFADPATGEVHEVRLTEAEADARKRENEERLRTCLRGFAELGVEPILLSSAAPDEILARFVAWADERMYTAVVA